MSEFVIETRGVTKEVGAMVESPANRNQLYY